MGVECKTGNVLLRPHSPEIFKGQCQEGANSEGQIQPEIHTYRCLDVGEPFLVERSEGKSILQLRGVCLTSGREGKGKAEVRLSIVGEI